MLEIPERIWKKIKGFASSQKVYRTNSDYVLCWKTIHLKENKPAVIKLFLWDIIEDARSELEAAKQLMNINHPNLVEIIAVKQHKDLGVYYIMEYWGEDLREHLGGLSFLPPHDWVIEVIKQLLEGIAELHRHEFVHRDIKPENTYIKDGIIKLGDYGLVKSEKWERILSTSGTPGYIPPEPAEERDHRWDIYSTGIVLLELLTGSRDIPDKIPDNLRNLWLVIQKATAKEPKERFKTVQEFIEAVNRRDPSVELRVNSENREKKDTFFPNLDRNGPGYVDGSGDGSGSASGAGFGDGSGDGSGSGKKITHPSPLLIEEKEKAVKTLPEPILLELEVPLAGVKLNLPPLSLDIVGKTLLAQFDLLLKANDINKALEVGQETHAHLERIISHNHNAVEIFMKVNIELAKLNYQSGIYVRAERLYQQCFVIESKISPSRSIYYLFNMANCQMKQNNMEGAIKSYQSAQHIVELSGYIDKEATAVILNNLACAYHLWRKYSTAQGLYKKALETMKRGKTIVAIILYNLALTYEAQGNKSATEPLYKQALQIAEKTMKPNDERLKIIRNTIKD
jgi:serine/threonine protein kinase